MSVNGHVRTLRTPRDGEGIHLGKWDGREFHLRAYPGAADCPAEIAGGVVGTESWTRLLRLGSIEDEHGCRLTHAEMEAETRPETPALRPRLYRDQFIDSRGNPLYEFC